MFIFLLFQLFIFYHINGKKAHSRGALGSRCFTAAAHNNNILLSNYIYIYKQTSNRSCQWLKRIQK